VAREEGTCDVDPPEEKTPEEPSDTGAEVALTGREVEISMIEDEPTTTEVAPPIPLLAVATEVPGEEPREVLVELATLLKERYVWTARSGKGGKRRTDLVACL
jgi:hypothetical protein